jgi:hypothetical protein
VKQKFDDPPPKELLAKSIKEGIFIGLEGRRVGGGGFRPGWVARIKDQNKKRSSRTLFFLELRACGLTVTLVSTPRRLYASL